MDISNDDLRRQATASRTEHASTMRAVRDLVERLFGDPAASSATKAQLAVGGIDRRRFLEIGGLSVATAAVLAACGSDDDDTVKAAVVEADDGKAGLGDVQVLRTASSLELVAVDVYQKAIDGGLMRTAAVLDAAKLFQSQHEDHADLFVAATKRLGGKVFEEPNPVVLQSMQAPLAALKDETGVLQLVLDLERVLAATYQSSAGGFSDGSLSQAAMGVGGVEARHVAVLAGALRQPAVPKAFQADAGAVTSGTGV